MFDRTFFKFALGFTAIIMASLGALYLAGYFEAQTGDGQTATVR